MYGSGNVITVEIVKDDDGGLFMSPIEFSEERDHLKKYEGKTSYEKYYDEIVQLTSQGLSCREISERIHISKATVSRVQNKIRNEHIAPLTAN